MKRKSSKLPAGDETLAMNGGKPVRRKPLPQEWCGCSFMDEREVEAVARVARAKSPFRFYGPDLQNEASQLEREFADKIGTKYALAVSSATAGLQVALGALGVGPGDEVLLPGYFWVATVGAVVRSGAVPVLVDCDDSFSIDPQKIEEKITPRTKAIIMVHMGGVIGRVREVVQVARKRGIKLIEDCAQAAGASQNGVRCGAFGDIGVFSFQLNKPMTSGEGGMVVTNDQRLYRRSQAIHDLGYPRNEAGRLDLTNEDTQLWGIGARMSELTAAFARVQLSKLDDINASMRNAKNRIRKALAGIPGISLRHVVDSSGDTGAFLYLTFEARETSLRFVKALRAEGIVGGAGGHYPIHMDDWGMHIYYNIPSLVQKRGNAAKSVWTLAENQLSATRSYAKGACPNLDALLARTMIICIASSLTEEDVSDIVTAIQKVAAHELTEVTSGK